MLPVCILGTAFGGQVADNCIPYSISNTDPRPNPKGSFNQYLMPEWAEICLSILWSPAPALRALEPYHPAMLQPHLTCGRGTFLLWPVSVAEGEVDVDSTLLLNFWFCEGLFHSDKRGACVQSKEGPSPGLIAQWGARQAPEACFMERIITLGFRRVLQSSASSSLNGVNNYTHVWGWIWSQNVLISLGVSQGWVCLLLTWEVYQKENKLYLSLGVGSWMSSA